MKEGILKVTMNSLLCLVVLSSIIFVNIGAVEHNRKIVYGVFRKYCKEDGSGVEWALNEKHTIMCFECECSEANKGIMCKGLGHQDGVLPPAGCIKRHLQTFEMQGDEKCCYQMVNADNQAVTCGEKVCA